MAILTPNATYKMNGVTIHEKIIPDGTAWKDASKAAKAGFSAGDLYKAQEKLSGGTGKVQTVTIHNTDGLARLYVKTYISYCLYGNTLGGKTLVQVFYF